MGRPSAPLHALVGRLVDYAGMFPPASLWLPAAAERYAAYRRGPSAWMLGRFVVPAGRLGELSEVAAALLPDSAQAIPWHISALVGPDATRDLSEVATFNARHAAGAGAGRALVDSLETRVATPEAVPGIAAALPAGVPCAFELPLEAEPGPFVTAIGKVHGVAKARLGGVVPAAVPPVDLVARWIASAAAQGVPIKATAGLHHALRAHRALTYETDAPAAVMHGFLNVFVAACVAHAAFASDGRRGRPDAPPGASSRRDDLAARLIPVLAETDARAFTFDDDAVAWRAVSLSTAEVIDARQHFALAFGSCSFEEPVEELRALGWLYVRAVVTCVGVVTYVGTVTYVGRGFSPATTAEDR